MGSSIGNNFKVTIFGQSHSQAVGAVIEGIPAGFEIDNERLLRFMKRRASSGELTTKRTEDDIPEIISGTAGSVTCGAPLTVIIKNKNVKKTDYKDIADTPRPGHADLTAEVKFFGHQDKSGGGHFSGRLTAPLCAAGGIAIQILEASGISIVSHIKSIAGIEDTEFDLSDMDALERLKSEGAPVIDADKREKMLSAVRAAMEDGDSVGGIIECAALGVPAGLGDPMFDGIENLISRAVFGIPAVKAVEFGLGFGSSKIRGSENNDEIIIQNEKICTATNNAGGILGGITDGMPVVFRAGFKPTPSISLAQRSVSLSEMKETEMETHGRHDPCVVLRAAAAVESAAAIAILDALCERKKQC